MGEVAVLPTKSIASRRCLKCPSLQRPQASGSMPSDSFYSLWDFKGADMMEIMQVHVTCKYEVNRGLLDFRLTGVHGAIVITDIAVNFKPSIGRER